MYQTAYEVPGSEQARKSHKTYYLHVYGVRWGDNKQVRFKYHMFNICYYFIIIIYYYYLFDSSFASTFGYNRKPTMA